MSILITGVYGFVSTNLINNLKVKHNLYGLDIVYPIREGVLEAFCWKDTDLESFPLQAPLQFDATIHLARKIHDTKNRSTAQSCFGINTSLTQKTFDLFLESSVKESIFFSSVEAAADSVVGNMLIEGVVPAPVGPYGESRIGAEEYIRGHFALLIVSSCECFPFWEMTSVTERRVYILRPYMIHGPGNKGNLNLLYSVVKEGIPWLLNNFENRRPFTPTDNLCYMIGGLLAKEVPTGIYHMGDNEALSTNGLVVIVYGAMGKQLHIWKMNKGLMGGCAKLGTLLRLPLNTGRLRRLTENYVVSNAKIKAALGVNKVPVTAKEGLVKTVRSFEEAK